MLIALVEGGGAEHLDDLRYDFDYKINYIDKDLPLELNIFYQIVGQNPTHAKRRNAHVTYSFNTSSVRWPDGCYAGGPSSRFTRRQANTAAC